MTSNRRFFAIWALISTSICIILAVSLVVFTTNSDKVIKNLEQQNSTSASTSASLSQELSNLQTELDLYQNAQDLFNLDFATTSNSSSIHSYSQVALQNGISGSLATPSIPGVEASIDTVWEALQVIKWAYTENSLSHKYVSSADVSSVLNGTTNIMNTLEHYPDLWPTEGGYITSYFGYRADPFTGQTKYHSGVDIAVNTGTNVYASGAGKVYYAGYDEGGYGYFVMIDHGNGLISLYGHLSKIKVTTGQTVSKGRVIALSGNTGRSTGPHLHAELRINGVRSTPKFPH